MNMKLKNKLIITSTIKLVVLLALPLIFVNLAKPHEAMGLMMTFFFAINPVASVIVSLFVGKDIKKLWWIPLSFAIVFLLSYWFVLSEIIWDLTIYAIIYALLGLLTMIILWIAKRK